MVHRASYTLKVLYQSEEQTCSFLLLWDEGKKDLYVGQPYPEKLLKDYETWQKYYLRYYRLQSNGEVKRSGSLSIAPSGDPSQDLRTAEDTFLNTFHRWLGEGNVREIEQQLQTTLIELSQVTAQNGFQTSKGTADSTVPPYQLDIYFACDAHKIQQLPWENWVARLVPENIPPGTIRLIRTTKDSSQQRTLLPASKLKKTRVLGILGDDANLALNQDWEQLKSLRAIADVERVTWDPDASAEEKIQTVFNRIQDDRGWDILFFAGHSDDAANRSGTFKLTANVTLAMSDLREQLEQARQQGLQVAIFNSCSGLRLADSLVRYGIQSVVMREPIHSDVALQFLAYLTQQLLAFNDIHRATLMACQQLRSRDRFSFPSAHLLPSFFSPPYQEPFQPKTIGWKHWIKRWLPTRREGVALGAIALLGSMVPVQDLLIDLRYLSQAVYRRTTQQLQQDIPSTAVQVIAVNQESINQALETEKYADFQSRPIDRRYLAEIIDELTHLNAETIGIDYLLHTKEINQSSLNKEIRESVEKKQTLFVLGIDTVDGLGIHKDTANLNWSLQGDMIFTSWIWAISLPVDDDCNKPCPFAYMAALGYRLNQSKSNNSSTSLPKPNLDSETSFWADVLDYISKNKSEFNSLLLSQPDFRKWNGQYLVDYSLPPAHVYQRTSSGTLLNEGLSNTDLSNQVILIGAGAYDAATESDSFSLPLATRYWRRFEPRASDEEFPDVLTGVEVHAYMTHHLLEGHLIPIIPGIWMLGLAALLGRSTTFYMLEQPATKRQKKILILMIVGAGLMSLQLYISANVAIPWLLPSCLFVTYTLPIFQRRPHA